ncbi:MAG: autotransporter-associated beta strand repeat-containing protein [Planctomycetaceae bacterium]
MPLNRWLKHCSQILRSGLHHNSRRRSLRRSIQRRLEATTTRVRRTPESLEERVLPASFSWVGDLNNSWSTNVAGDTNWSGNATPISGDSLVFDGSSAGMLDNDFPTNSSFSMTSNTGGYTITGHVIQLDNEGTDIIQIAAENLIRTPLKLDASAIEVQSGVLDLQRSVTGTAGLTKLGDGTLILTRPTFYSGPTTVEAGSFEVDGEFLGTGAFDIADTATLGGTSHIGSTVELSGILSPGSLRPAANPVGSFSAAALNMNSSGVLRLNISGNSAGEYDTLQITNAAALNGTLEVAIAENLIPADGTIFRVLSADSVTGYFRSFNGLNYNGGRLVPIQTPEALLLLATTIPTGGVTFCTATSAEGESLAQFFANNVSSLTITGGFDVLSQQLRGTFTLTRRAATATDSALVILAANHVSMDLSGSSSSLVSVSNGYGVVILSEAGLAADLTVTVAESLESITFSGTFGLAINSTNSDVSETVQVGGNTVSIDLPAGPDVRLSASNTVLTTDIIDVRGNFTLETNGSEDTREILLGASDITAFPGDDGRTADDATDDVGLLFNNGSLLAFVNSGGNVALRTTGAGQFAFDVPVYVEGVASLEINTTGEAVQRTLTVGGITGTLDLADGLNRVALRNVSAAFPGFAEVTGDFAIERTVDGSTTTLSAATAAAGVFVGINRGLPDELGVRLHNVGLALLIEKTADSPAKYAVAAAGDTVSLAGLPDLQLKGSLAFEVNQLGREINTTITPLSGPDIPLVFTTADSVQRWT